MTPIPKCYLLTVVEAIAITSMPLNEFVLFRNKHYPDARQGIISCSIGTLNCVDIPTEIDVYEVGKSVFRFYKALKFIIRECNKNNEELIIHLHSPRSSLLFFVASFFAGIKNKTVFTVHSTYNCRSNKYKFLSFICSILSNYTVCVSETSYEGYSSLAKRIKGNHLLSITNGVSDSRIMGVVKDMPPHDEIADMSKLVCVGRLISIKNQQFLLDVLKKLPNTELLLIGEGDSEESLMKKASKIGVSKRVSFVGLIPRKEVFEKINTCGIYVSSSLVEGMPISVLEAMSLGLIPIMSNIPSHCEIARSCSQCVTLPFNVTDWYNTIKRYQSLERGKIIEITNEIKKTTRENFSLERMHLQYDRIYRKLLKPEFDV